MITAETTQRNIVIADWINTEEYRDSDKWQIPNHTAQLFQFGLVPKSKPEALLFDVSYDWVMPVVERIESLGFTFDIYNNVVSILNHNEPDAIKAYLDVDLEVNKLQAIQIACAEFILKHG